MDVERESVRRVDSSDSSDKHRFLVQTRERPPGGQYEPPCFTGYYILDVLSGGVSTLPCTAQDLPRMSCMVALRSRIYIVGMPIHNSNAKKPSSLYFLDSTNSSESNCWKRGPPPIRPTGFPVAFGGKIYYFGKSDLQVFYPTQRNKPNWRLIKNTPVKSRWLVAPVLADHKNDRIIAFFDKPSSMFAYYPSREQWECLQEDFPCWLRHCKLVTLLDGVIYVHHLECENIFTAYDIATKQWLNVQVSPDAGNVKSHLPFYSYNALVSLGNDILCLLASRYEDRQTDPENPTTLVHIVRFKVQLINNDDTKKVVLVTPLSSQYFDLDSTCTLHSCIAL